MINYVYLNAFVVIIDLSSKQYKNAKKNFEYEKTFKNKKNMEIQCQKTMHLNMKVQLPLNFNPSSQNKLQIDRKKINVWRKIKHTLFFKQLFSKNKNNKLSKKNSK